MELGKTVLTPFILCLFPERTNPLSSREDQSFCPFLGSRAPCFLFCVPSGLESSVMFVSSLGKLKDNTYFILHSCLYRMSCSTKRDSHDHCKLHHNVLCGLFSSPVPQNRKIKHDFFSASAIASNGGMCSYQRFTKSSNCVQAAVQDLQTPTKMCFRISERCKRRTWVPRYPDWSPVQRGNCFWSTAFMFYDSNKVLSQDLYKKPTN